MTRFPKVVTTPHYHLWTDALHARALSHQANNRWDRGTYIRWCITTAWSTLETACQDATGDIEISYSFRRKLDSAIQSMELPPLTWGQGIWQEVVKIQDLRKRYMHRFVTEKDLFPEAKVADEAIKTIRSAIIEIYSHVGRPAPPWTADNDDRGWDKGSRSMAALTAVHADADTESEQAIRVCYVTMEREFTSDVLPSGSDWKPYAEGLLKNVNVPISKIRVYRGSDLIHDQDVEMRGA